MKEDGRENDNLIYSYLSIEQIFLRILKWKITMNTIDDSSQSFMPDAQIASFDFEFPINSELDPKIRRQASRPDSNTF